MLWSVLYYVNPTTITIVLILSLLAALMLARFRPRIRVFTVLLAAVYLVILAAPLSEHTSIGEGGRSVTWDPMLSFQDIARDPFPSAFGIMIDNDHSVHYSPEELTEDERQFFTEAGVDQLFVYGDPGDELTVTDAGGEATYSPQAVSMVQEELEFQEEHAAQVEEDGPWGHSDGLALQERTLNTLLFVPIGIASFFAFRSWTARLFFGPVLSLTIEGSQWALAADRMADTGDLLVNGVGSLGGTLLALIATTIIRIFTNSHKREETRTSPPKYQVKF